MCALQDLKLVMSLFPWLVAVSPADEESKPYLKSKVQHFLLFFFGGVVAKPQNVLSLPHVYYSEASHVLHS